MSKSKAKPLKIALIDDNEDYLFTMSTFLTRNGYTVLTAGNAQKGLSLIKRRRPHLILLDVMMGSCYAGFELWRKLQDDPKLKAIPVIGISGMQSELGVRPDGPEDREYFYPTAFLDKPVDHELLLKTIAKVMQAEEERKNMPTWKKALEAHNQKFV
jgi:CheY-like chemotaxis protein